MVIGLFIITAIPTVTGVSQAISAQKTREEREKDAERMNKFHIDITCVDQKPRAKEVHQHRLVLKNDRVWIGPSEAHNPCSDGFVAEAFYIEYPDNEVSRGTKPNKRQSDQFMNSACQFNSDSSPK